MPKLAEGVYSQYFDAVLKLANREGGASRKDIMDETGASRPIAEGVIDRLKLKKVRTEGRAEFFGPGKGTAKVAGEVAVVGGSDDDKPAAENPSDTVASLVSDGAPTTSEPAKKKRGRPKKNPLPEVPTNGNGPGHVSAPAASSDVQAEIKKTLGAISEALDKAKNGEQTAIEQTALARSLQTVLIRLLEQAATG